MASSDPAEQKALGRAVFGFGDDVRVQHRISIVRQANLSEFGQNLDLLRPLLETDN